MTPFTCIPLLALMNGFACVDSVTTIEPSAVVEMAHIAGFESDEIETLLCVIEWESSFRPYVASWNSTSFGLTQIHRGWSEGFVLPNGDRLPAARPDLSPQNVMDPMVAMHGMKFIYERSGWEAWDGYAWKCKDAN